MDKTGRTRGETAARVNLVAKVLESRENILLDPLEGGRETKKKEKKDEKGMEKDR